MYKRVVGVIPALIIVITFMFLFVRLIPRDPAKQVAGPQATKEDVELVRGQLGFDKPLPQQYVSYVVRLMRGDLDISLRTKRPVLTEVQGRYMSTVQLTLLSLIWSVTAGVLISVWLGRNRSKWQDYIGMTATIPGISVPSFQIGFMLTMVPAVKYRLLPTTGAGSFKNLALPSITLGVSIAAIITRFIRSSVIGVMKEDYVRTARTRDPREETVVWKHVSRNYMIPVVMAVGLQFGFPLGGFVVTEIVFASPGPDSLLIESMNYRNYPAAQSLILIFSLHFVLINLVVDVLYIVLNPEVQLN